MEVKQALKDERFRESLPAEVQPDVKKFMGDQGCACNVPLYRKLIRDYPDKLSEYYPDRELIDVSSEVESLSRNRFSVINCHIDELEDKLKSLPMGRKQVAVARFEDQATVVINEMDVAF
jgi:hypothetical protein